MKMTKWIVFAICYCFLLIFGIVSTSESRVIYANIVKATNKGEKPNVQKGNIITVPMMTNCDTGYFLDHRKKCRKVIDAWSW